MHLIHVTNTESMTFVIYMYMHILEIATNKCDPEKKKHVYKPFKYQFGYDIWYIRWQVICGVYCAGWLHNTCLWSGANTNWNIKQVTFLCYGNHSYLIFLGKYLSFHLDRQTLSFLRDEDYGNFISKMCVCCYLCDKEYHQWVNHLCHIVPCLGNMYISVIY